jgi:hypothetical protein
MNSACISLDCIAQAGYWSTGAILLNVSSSYKSTIMDAPMARCPAVIRHCLNNHAAYSWVHLIF